MVKTNVSSSFIKSLSSNKRKKTFTAYMSNGSRYRYIKVPHSLAIEVHNAESRGKAFNSLVKGKFQFETLT